jgi:4-amino-4-deoxy-L-arabinose transferase-like glycosyltransferase
VFICLVVGAAFRTWHLGQPIKYDEAYSYLHFARRPLHEGLLDFHVPNNHLLHTLLSHVSLRLLGDHEWSLRVPALLAGLLSVAAIWQLGKRTAGREVALLATGMTAASAVEISYSANARGYTLVAWLGLVLADRIVAAVRRGRPVDWLLAGVAAVLGFYTVPTMLFCFAGALGWAIWQVARGRCYASGAAGFGRLVVFTSAVGLMSATLYGPAIAFSGFEAFRHDILTPHGLGRLFGDLADAWWEAVGSWSEGIAPAWALSALALVGVMGLYFRRDTRGAAMPIGAQTHRGLAATCPTGAGLWLAMFLATAAVTALSRQAPPPRVFTIVAPYFYLLAATGLLSAVFRIASRLPGLENAARYAAPALTILVVLGGGVHVVTGAILRHGETGRCPAARPAAAWLAAQAPGAGRVMAPLGCDVPILYYVTRAQVSIQWMGRPAAGETVYLLIPGDRSPRDVFADPVLAPLVRGVTFGRWQRAHEFREASLWKAVVDPAGEYR